MLPAAVSESEDKDWAEIQRARREAEKSSRFNRFLMIYLGMKICLGEEQREGWTAPIPVYLFWCGDCEHWAISYPHGFIETQRLVCSNCQVNHDFVPLWVSLAKILIGIWFILKLNFCRIFRIKLESLSEPRRKLAPVVMTVISTCEKCRKVFEEECSSEDFIPVCCKDCRLKKMNN
jgi:hypothetical protein